ncbi:hypothetical protein [Bacillus sp. Marseille-Q3570]|uniref:hypothetical protein n=1 Tax=Bacillus sp. Marseille-Q3570 TaxID=2963522 RepID=UPI0021B78816|nr:hypothetical protein [Bacillus sp. Marseille-Q3570]
MTKYLDFMFRQFKGKIIKVEHNGTDGMLICNVIRNAYIEVSDSDVLCIYESGKDTGGVFLGLNEVEGWDCLEDIKHEMYTLEEEFPLEAYRLDHEQGSHTEIFIYSNPSMIGCDS